jgi:homoserine dehydrogenase
MGEALRVGIAGLGTVGASVVRILRAKADELTRQCGRPIEVTAVSARDRSRDRGIDVSSLQWFDDPRDLAARAEVDVVVELIGGADGAAHDTVAAGLGAGRHVVTANKALLASAWRRPRAGRGREGRSPELRSGRGRRHPGHQDDARGDGRQRRQRVFGILNGTCNYILTRMEAEGISFDACLADAQRLGYAEADPTFDIEGHDTAHKLAILTSLAFGTRIDRRRDLCGGHPASAHAEDLKAADDLGYRVKLLGVAREDRKLASSSACIPPWCRKLRPRSRRSHGVTNAVAIETDMRWRDTLVGPGAGGDSPPPPRCWGPRRHRARRRQYAPVRQCRWPCSCPPSRPPMQRHEGGYYIRLAGARPPRHRFAINRQAHGRPTHLAGVHRPARAAPRPKAETIRETPTTVPVILITYATTEEAVRRAIASPSRRAGVLAGRPQVIRIESD